MKSKLIILTTLLVVGFSIDPPLWPNVWTQEFVQNYTIAGGVYTVAKHWYDYPNSNERVTFQNGQYETICGSIMPGVKTACTQLITKGNLWVIFPEQQKCCRCCDGASGCLVKDPRWIQPFSYVGEEDLSGEMFYKWTYHGQVDYYAKEDERRTPRRVTVPGYKTEDFIMNTYTQDPISDDIFAIPAYCTKDCSRATVCGQLQPGKQLKTEMI